jgi:hypothetical protein
MSRNSTFFTVIIISFLAAACGGGAPPQESTAPMPADAPAEAAAAPEPADEGIAARAMLDQALAEAKKWQSDAELTVVTTSLAEGPRHGFWFYDVQSPSTGTCTRIRVLANGRVENVGTGEDCVLMKPVSAGFIDSPVAWDAALAAGFVPGDSAQFGLRFQRDEALPAPRECWVLWSDADGDESAGVIRGWCVDPATGQFVTRLSGKGRIEPR